MGIVVITWILFKDSLPPQYRSPFDVKMTVVLGTLTILLVGLGVYKLFSKKT
jgi:solute:Na+ symporter, SSS family